MRPPTVSDDTVALPAASNASAMGEGAKRSSAYRRRKSGDVRKGKIRASNSIASPVPRSPPKGLWSVSRNAGLARRSPRRRTMVAAALGHRMCITERRRYGGEKSPAEAGVVVRQTEG